MAVALNANDTGFIKIFSKVCGDAEIVVVAKTFVNASLYR